MDVKLFCKRKVKRRKLDRRESICWMFLKNKYEIIKIIRFILQILERTELFKGFFYYDLVFSLDLRWKK